MRRPLEAILKHDRDVFNILGSRRSFHAGPAVIWIWPFNVAGWKKEGVEGVNGPPDLKMHYSTQSRLMHLRRIGCAVHGFTLLISTLSSCLLRTRSCTYSIKLWQHMMTLNDWRLWRIVCLSPDMETQQHFSERQSTYTWFISLHRLMDQWNVTLCQMVPEKNVFKSLQMSLTF